MGVRDLRTRHLCTKAALMIHLTALTIEFLRADSGAVTVDVVPLMAALVGLALAVMAVISGGVEDLSADLDTQLVDHDIMTEFAPTVVRIRGQVN